MNTTANIIKQRMSVREPLGKALDEVVRLTDELSLKKPTQEENEAFLKDELAKAQTVCPLCKDFERDFPSFAFSIATGIGKTRLMGACIAYLYQKKGIRHFFVLAPNLTLYDKAEIQIIEKKKAAMEYCTIVSKEASKPWQYAIIPHSVISRTMQLEFVIANSMNYAL